MLLSTNYDKTVSAMIRYADPGHNAWLNMGAVDDSPGQGVAFDTVNMRNQPLTHQFELQGSNTFHFCLLYTF